MLNQVDYLSRVMTFSDKPTPALIHDPDPPEAPQSPNDSMEEDVDIDEPLTIIALPETFDPILSEEEKRKVRAAAHHFILEQYNSGVKLFSKEAFRDAVRVFASAAAEVEQRGVLSDPSAHVVSVTGLDGVAVDFPIETGAIYPYSPYPPEYVCVK
jgi:hypothetical protein